MAKSHHMHVRGRAEVEAAKNPKIEMRSQIAARYRAAVINRAGMSARLYGQEGEK